MTEKAEIISCPVLIMSMGVIAVKQMEPSKLLQPLQGMVSLRVFPSIAEGLLL